MKLNKIIESLEKWAPPIYQEDYDNSGLMVGDRSSDILGCLISLDCTENIVEEAIKKNCNLIISHHPIIFGGLKSLDMSQWEARVIKKAIKNDINIYALHTNLDNIFDGVNKKICEILNLIDIEILSPKIGYDYKLEVYIPEKYRNTFVKKIFDIGSGYFGNYSECSFEINGRGSFQPEDGSNPLQGKKGEKEIVDELKLEIYFDKKIKNKVEKCIKDHHPYDEAVYYISKTSNLSKNIGSGMIGKSNIKFNELLNLIKKDFNENSIKYTKKLKDDIGKIAVCGGSGSFLINESIKKKADVYITSDLKYHDFFKANDKITLIDIGHYESEKYTKELIFEFLNKKLTNIALHLSDENTNPIKYY